MEASGVDGGSVNDDDVGERWMAGSVVGMVGGGLYIITIKCLYQATSHTIIWPRPGA